MLIILKAHRFFYEFFYPGYGVFAEKKFSKGDFLLEYEGMKFMQLIYS